MEKKSILKHSGIPASGVQMREPNSSCPSCASLLVVNHGRIPSTGRFAGRLLPAPLPGGSLFECETCHLLFRHPRLSKEQLDALYRSGRDDSWSARVQDRSDWRIAAGWIWSIQADGARVLDVGCFDGGFLEALGFRFRRFGVEVHPGALDQARAKGIEIIADDFEALADAHQRFDCITALDVIEHVHDPLQFLKTLRALLAPGGRIILSTGNTDAASWRLLGSRYWYAAFAEHVSFINPRWCRRAAKQTGLRIEQCRVFPHARFGFVVRMAQTIISHGYLRWPRLIHWLRRDRLGGLDARRFPELADYPPPWNSASDHFAVMLRIE